MANDIAMAVFKTTEHHSNNQSAEQDMRSGGIRG
jgi:hypothetical protein